MSQKIQVLKHQLEFINDDYTRQLALVGGFGCGKTHSFCLKAIDLASKNIGYTGLLLEPTYGMIEDTLAPQMQSLLHEYNIPFTVKMSTWHFQLHFKTGIAHIKMRSAENHMKIRGMNLAFAGIDEVDTIKPDVALAAWRSCQSRLRLGNVFQLFTTSTPEGFGFLYKHFEKEQKENRRLIRARTYDNPFLPEEFIEDLRDDYPPALLDAYLEGKFVNLTQGVVYTSFDRELNNTELDYEWVLDQEKRHPHNSKYTLHIGQDFNVGKCYSGIHIIVDKKPYAIAELAESKNTEHVIERIKSLYPDRHIIVYPDSSGKNERSNASQTDITLLKNAGFKLKYPNKNPFIKNRVGSVNAMLCNANKERRYFINTTRCPIMTESLEQQVYDKTGMPDKSHDNDHPVDAIGYFIHQLYPLRRANVKPMQIIGF